MLCLPLSLPSLLWLLEIKFGLKKKPLFKLGCHRLFFKLYYTHIHYSLYLKNAISFSGGIFRLTPTIQKKMSCYIGEE